MSPSLAAAVALVIAFNGSISIRSEIPNVHLSESQAAASSTATDPNADIVAQWQDIIGTNFFLRVGTYNAALDEGFGMTKIIAKHGIYSGQSVEYVTKNAWSGEARGMDFTRVAYANKIACGTGGCEVLETVAVRAVMSRLFVTTYYGVDVNAEIGVKTM